VGQANIPFAIKEIAMKWLLMLVVVASMVSMTVGCKAKIDTDGASVQSTH
jgi:hypothetical protein